MDVNMTKNRLCVIWFGMFFSIVILHETSGTEKKELSENACQFVCQEMFVILLSVNGMQIWRRKKGILSDDVLK